MDREERMDIEEGKKYAALSIPQRTPRSDDGAAAALAQNDNASKIDLAGTEFAEVDLAPAPKGGARFDSALRFYSSIAPAEPIAQRAADPIRQVFFDMRSLASDRPFARNDSELFYKQAKFMEDFTDDYAGEAKFNMYFPYYQHMGYEQLRTYFTWRTKVRRGETPQISVSYVFLYIYELLSGIGVDSPMDGLRKLVSVWDGFLRYAPALENYMPKWFKDYHVYYGLPHSFSDFIEEHRLKKFFPLIHILDSGTENSLPAWNSLSRYDVTKSRFYNDGNEQICIDCFDAVIESIAEFCAGRGARFEDLLIYRVSNKTPWYPFRQALFTNWFKQTNRDVILPCQERYYCRNSQWTASLPVYFSTQRDFASYLIKSTEMNLRKATGYKYKLTVETGTSRGAFRELKELGAKNTDIDRVIEQSVADYYRMLTRTVVTVNHENLARIREESLGTQGKLIVPEDGEGRGTAASVQEPEAGNHVSGLVKNSATEREGTPVDTTPQGLRISGIQDECSGLPLPDPGLNTQSFESYTRDSGQPDDSWLALRNALGAIEIKALAAALRDETSVKAIAMEHGIMLEILADGINEKAADLIGDSILEIDGGMVIYDEYKANVEYIVNPQNRDSPR